MLQLSVWQTKLQNNGLLICRLLLVLYIKTVVREKLPLDHGSGHHVAFLVGGFEDDPSRLHLQQHIIKASFLRQRELDALQANLKVSYIPNLEFYGVFLFLTHHADRN